MCGARAETLAAVIIAASISASLLQPVQGVQPDCRGCVAFRLDDIQDYYYGSEQRAFIEMFRQNNASVTIGIIGGEFGEDPEMVDFIRQYKNDSRMEIANHGWLHEDFGMLNDTSSQQELLERTNQKIHDLLGQDVMITTFIAPLNSINEQTYEAVANSGLYIISADVYRDAIFTDNQTAASALYHLPATAEGSIYLENGTREAVSALEMIAKIHDSIRTKDNAVVMLHPWDDIESVRSVISYILDETDYEIVTLREMAFGENEVPEGLSTSTSSIASGHPFKLKVNEIAYLEQADLNFRFVNVTEDSRCPSDVQCIWAGQVSILVEATRAPNGDVAGSSTLTIVGGGGPALDGSSTAMIAGYIVKFTSAEPYPVSTKTIQLSDYSVTLIVFKADANDSESIIASNPVAVDAAGFRLDRLDVGREVTLSIAVYNKLREERPFVAILEARSLIDGGVTRFLAAPNGTVSANSWIAIGLPWTPDLAGEYQLRTFLIDSFDEPQILSPVLTSEIAGSINEETIVTLREGQREGPLLVQRIYPDRVEGLNFPEYPIAMEEGLPITLRIGEKASNGCTVVLTLTKIQDDNATFLKTIDESRPCPICWYQLELMSGWP